MRNITLHVQTTLMINELFYHDFIQALGCVFHLNKIALGSSSWMVSKRKQLYPKLHPVISVLIIYIKIPSIINTNEVTHLVVLWSCMWHLTYNYWPRLFPMCFTISDLEHSAIDKIRKTILAQWRKFIRCWVMLHRYMVTRSMEYKDIYWFTAHNIEYGH